MRIALDVNVRFFVIVPSEMLVMGNVIALIAWIFSLKHIINTSYNKNTFHIISHEEKQPLVSHTQKQTSKRREQHPNQRKQKIINRQKLNGQGRTLILNALRWKIINKWIMSKILITFLSWREIEQGSFLKKGKS